MEPESLPSELFNQIKYLTLEHPCAKIIKQAFDDFERYLDTIFSLMVETTNATHIMAMASSHTSFMVFNEWRKRCARKGVDLFNVPDKKRSKYLGVTGTVRSLMHYNNLQLIRAMRRDGYFLQGAKPSR